MDFSILINRMNPFTNLGVAGAFFYFDFIFNRISSKQTVNILIRCCILRRLIWVCTVCLYPKNGMLGLYGLKLSTPTLIQTQNSQFHEMLGTQFSCDGLFTERMRKVEGMKSMRPFVSEKQWGEHSGFPQALEKMENG